MQESRRILTILFSIALLSVLEAQESHRVALVIGNAAYAVSPLDTPVNDAVDVAAALERMGFTVILKMDLTLRGMNEILDDFYAQSLGADIALFYFSGHGAQAPGRFGNENYLLPVDLLETGGTPSEADVTYGAIPLGKIANELEGVGVKASVLIVDACRSIAVVRDGKSTVDGLTLQRAPSGSIYLFAASEGQRAQSGKGRNSIYTKALLAYLETPGVSLAELAGSIAEAVYTATAGLQEPSFQTSLRGNLYLVAGSSSAPPPTSSSPVTEGRFVRLPGGTFTMGSPSTEQERDSDEGPQHQVAVLAFSIGAYEVTVGEFRAFVTATGYRTKAEREVGGRVWTGRDWETKADANWMNPYFSQTDQDPVVLISWFDAVEYCNWRSRQEGLRPAYSIGGIAVGWDRSANGYRLPTEAEWEYACRAGTTTATAFGDSLTSAQANFNGDFPYRISTKGPYLGKTQMVGSFKPNGWDIYDMHGNVWEWCWDWYDSEYYTYGIGVDPTGAPSGDSRVLRGGGWGYDGGTLRSAERGGSGPDIGNHFLGFRLVLPNTESVGISESIPNYELYLPDAVNAFEAISGISDGEVEFSIDEADIINKLSHILDTVKGNSLDLIICLDTTDSMSDDIEVIKSNLGQLLYEKTIRFKSCRFGLVFYKDYFEDYVVKRFNFTSDIFLFLNALSEERIIGGRDIPEAVYEALYEALTGFSWAAEERMIILIGDAPPHPIPRGKVDFSMVKQRASELGVSISCILLPH